MKTISLAELVSTPYRWRTWMRVNTPYVIADRISKGEDCSKAGGEHEWYNQDSSYDACYHCQVTKLKNE